MNIQTLFRTKVEELYSQKGMYDKKNLYASDLSSCHRKVFLSFGHKKYLKQSDYIAEAFKTIKAKRTGEVLHADFMKILKEIGFLVEAELPIVDPEYFTSCRLDAVIRVNKEYYIVEFKTSSEYSYEKYNSEGEPLLEHYYQLQWYFDIYERYKDKNEKLSKTFFGTPITKGYIVYENKNNHDFCWFPIRKNDSAIKKLREEARKLKQEIDSNILPERGYEKEDWHCKFCQYFNFCYPEEQKNKILIQEEEKNASTQD